MRGGEASPAPIRQARMARAVTTAAVAGLALLLGGCFGASAESVPTGSPSLGTPAPTSLPDTELTELATGLDDPSSLRVVPDGTILVTAGTEIIRIGPDHERVTVPHKLTDLSGDGAELLDLALSPTFPASPEFFLCYRTGTEIKVVPMSTDPELSVAQPGTPLLTGLPLPPSGRGGCKIDFGPDGYLYIGTSDGGNPTAPQDLTALGGKILRVDAATQQGPESNPFATRSDPVSKLVYSYGHREIVGLAWHPVTTALYAIDRGPGRQDEINAIVAGGNYGWNPASKSQTSYTTDGVPMTDLAITNVRPAAWNSGDASPGLGPAIFVRGSQWGVLTTDLGVSNTSGPRVLFVHVTGEILGPPVVLDSLNPVGPTRAIAQEDDGSLLVLTATNRPERLLRVTVPS